MSRCTTLFVLRATREEIYDCPDNGTTKICDVYEDIRFSFEREALDATAADLNRGHGGDYWSEKRANELRRLHPNYDDACTYSVHDVSDLLA